MTYSRNGVMMYVLHLDSSIGNDFLTFETKVVHVQLPITWPKYELKSAKKVVSEQCGDVTTLWIKFIIIFFLIKLQYNVH